MTRRIGELLQSRTRLADDNLSRALRLQPDGSERIGELLVRLGLVSERDLAEALAEQLGIGVAGAADYPAQPPVENSVTPEFLRRARAVPVALDGERVIVAMADPLDAFTREALALALGREIEPRVGVPTDIDAAIQRQYGGGTGAMQRIAGGVDMVDEEPDQADVQQLKDLASEAPIIRLVNLVIGRALEARASDIHIEPFGNRLQVRYRVDGVLRNVEAPPGRSAAAVISRIKVMANLNIAERRLPQDGRIKVRIEGREVDMRISTVPTLHGESVVIRILDKDRVPLDFAALGFEGATLDTFRRILDVPHGILLVTGPTGSGKTTSLYAALETLNTPDRKILTVEDPVEYQLEGVNQIHVKPSIGLTFAFALRSILRQDPDVIMVGEMRDLETAKIAVQAALTGHKVFSTLHTNDAASSVTRLLDMGVEDYLVTSTVNGVVAQRLVRTLCPKCREPYEASPELAAETGLDRLAGGGPVNLWRAAGCDACEQTGYRGRSGIVEVMVMSEPVRRAVLGRGDAGSVREAARGDGTTSMFENGLRKALAGQTTLEEVGRVTRED